MKTFDRFISVLASFISGICFGAQLTAISGVMPNVEPSWIMLLIFLALPVMIFWADEKFGG